LASSWHYQVLRHKDGLRVWYGVHGYYHSSSIGPSWAVEPLLSGESVEELKEVLKMIEQDIYKHGVKDYE
jgi:hypothetical protein